MATKQQSAFSNQALLLEELPSIETLAYRPIEALYASTNRIVNLAISLVIAMMALCLHYQTLIEVPRSTNNLIVVGVLLLTGLALLHTVYCALADVRKFYALRQQDISFTSGLVFKKTVTQPILRIQHVELKRGPIDRKVGLAKLQVFSAGGVMHTFEIPGLTLDDAEAMRQFILSHKDANHHG